jgi:hypothetical protein
MGSFFRPSINSRLGLPSTPKISIITRRPRRPDFRQSYHKLWPPTQMGESS